MSDEIVVTRRVLERARFGATMTSSVKYGVHPDFLADALLHRLEVTVLKDTLAQDEYVSKLPFQVPATSWQMFKSEHADSWWLGWLVRRRPVRWDYRTHHAKVAVERSHIYPQASIALPELGRPVIFEKATVTNWWTPR